jgi:hypothetical protein
MVKMADVLPNDVLQWWKSRDGSRRPAPPSAWLKNGIGGSSGADAARYLLRPPPIQPVDLNSRIGAMARERGWNPCKLSSDQRGALLREVLDSLPNPVPPELAQPKPLTPSEQHAADLLEQAHAAAGGTREYSEGKPGIGAARFDHPRLA